MINEFVTNLGKVDTIAAGHRHTLGLKSDGTVMAVGLKASFYLKYECCE